VDGTARAVTVVGRNVIVGGSFSYLVSPSGAKVAHPNLASIDLVTGSALTAFRASTNGAVLALATDGASVYVGGAFTTINGVARPYLAKINRVTGAVDTSWRPSVPKAVRAIAYRNGTVYFGGDFGKIGAVERNYAAAVDYRTGALRTFNPNSGGRIFAIAISPNGTTAYLGGRSLTMGGQGRAYLAAVGTGTGGLVGPGFAAPASPGVSWDVMSVDVSADGATVLGATDSDNNKVVAWSTSTGQERWEQHPVGDGQAVDEVAGRVFFGFHGGFSVGGQVHGEYRLLSSALTNGAVSTTFRPASNGGIGVDGLADAAGRLVAVGDFTQMGRTTGLHGVAIFE